MTELQYDPMGETPPAIEEKKARRGTWLWVMLVALAIALAGWLFSRSNPSPRVATPVSSPSTTTAAAPVVSEPAPRPPSSDPGLPELENSDDFVRALITELFGSPDLDRWLASGEELLQQGVRALLAISEKRAAGRYLSFLPIEGRFAVTARGGDWIIAPQSYRRYDRVVDAFVGLDARQVARLAERLAPLLSRAMDENAFPGTGFDSALSAAIAHLLATPLPAEELEVVPQDDGSYRFADPRLEALTAPQKQLLRLGPRNGARVRAKLAEIEMALVPTHP